MPAPSRLRATVAASLLAFYCVIVGFVVFWPTPVDGEFRGPIFRVLAVLHSFGVPNWLGYIILEFTSNVLMFVPLGLLIFFVLPRRFAYVALVICPGISIGIEVTQGLALSQRYATVSDVIANSLGGVIGVVLALVLRGLIHKRDQRLLESTGTRRRP